MKALFAFAFSFAICLALVAQPTRIAIIDFENISGIAKYDGLGKAMSSMLISDIEANVSPKRLQLVERAQIQKVIKEQNFQASGSVDKATAVKAGKILGVTYMLVGDVYVLNEQLIINARLTNTETGDIVFSKKQEGKTTAWLPLKTAIAQDIASSLAMPFTEPTIQDSELAIGTISTFGNAIAASDQGNIDKAQSLADAVTDINPEFAYVDDLRKEIEKLKQQVAQNTADIKKNQQDIQELNKSGDLVINASTYEELLNNLGSVLITDKQRISILRKIVEKFPKEAEENGGAIFWQSIFPMIQKNINKPLSSLIDYLFDSSQPSITNEELYQYCALYSIGWALQWKINMATDKNEISNEIFDADNRAIENIVHKVTTNIKNKAILIFLTHRQSYSLDNNNNLRDSKEAAIWHIYSALLKELNYPYLEVLNSRYISSNVEVPLFELYTLTLYRLNAELDQINFDLPNFWKSEMKSSAELGFYESHIQSLNLPLEKNSVNQQSEIPNKFLVRTVKPTETIIQNIIKIDSINFRYSRILDHFKDSLQANMCYLNDNLEQILMWSDSIGFNNSIYILSNQWPVGKNIVLLPFGNTEIIATIVGPAENNQDNYLLVENESSKKINTADFITFHTSNSLSDVSTSGRANFQEDFHININNCRDERLKINSITTQFHSQEPPSYNRYFGPGNSQVGPVKLSNKYKFHYELFLRTYQDLIRPYSKFANEPDTLEFMETINSIYNVWVHEGLTDISNSVFEKGWNEIIYKHDPRIAALHFYLFNEVLYPESELSEQFLFAGKINLAHSLLICNHYNHNEIGLWHGVSDAYNRVDSKQNFGKEFGKLNRDEMILQDWKEFANRGIIPLETLKQFNNHFKVISLPVE
jgi:TolB-like protein